MESWKEMDEIHILGYLTPRASLGLESFPHYSRFVLEGLAESFWMGVGVWDPCSSRLLCSEAVLWCCPHQHWGGKSANSHCEPGNPGLPSLSQEFGTFMGAEMPWEGAGLCQTPESRSWDTAGGMFYMFQRRDIASDPPAFPQPIYVCLCGQDKISFMRHPLAFPSLRASLLVWNDFLFLFPLFKPWGEAGRNGHKGIPPIPAMEPSSFTPELSLELHFALEKLPAIFHWCISVWKHFQQIGAEIWG